MRKICVITGSRAEYGLLRWVMGGIDDDPQLSLQIIATGMHLSVDFGLTYREIEKDGFRIDRKVEILTSSDTSVGIAKSMGLGLIGFADAYKELQPDLILVLGDRFEIFSAVSAALVAKIPVAHIHGGEITMGAFDDAFRHSITKMSHIHFVATEPYRQRVIQLGEHPDRVFLVGGLGVDSILRTKLLDKSALEAALDFRLGHKNLLITFHPTTLGTISMKNQIEEILSAFSALEDTKLIFTLPNADIDSHAIAKAVKNFVADHPNARAYSSLGQVLYLSCIAHVDGVVGNSSSGLLEAPTLRKGTINIGDRQEGRLQARSVINCAPTYQDITNSLVKLYSQEFQSSLYEVVNPYGDGGASEKIVTIIKNQNIKEITKKIFYDCPVKNYLES